MFRDVKPTASDSVGKSQRDKNESDGTVDVENIILVYNILVINFFTLEALDCLGHFLNIK